MCLSSKEIEEIKKNSDAERLQESVFFKLALKIFAWLYRIPYLRNKFENTKSRISLRLFKFQKVGKHRQAVELAEEVLDRIEADRRKSTDSMKHHEWWSFMMYAAESLVHVEDDAFRERIIERAESGLEPFKGNFVAETYLSFSRMKYDEKSYEEAIRFAERSAESDETWAEPELLLGWYGLILGDPRAERYLMNAMDKDQRILFRVANNDVFQQRPDILRKLKNQFETLSNDSPRNKLRK